MCKRFAEYCQENGISLSLKGFTLQYDINIPRQAGLSGSSAIACATLSCLLQHYNVADRCSLLHTKPLPSPPPPPLFAPPPNRQQHLADQLKSLLQIACFLVGVCQTSTIIALGWRSHPPPSHSLSALGCTTLLINSRLLRS